MFENFRTFETEFAGRPLVIETGKMTQLANGACLVRYGEIFLKGLNRPYFIRALVRKVRYAVRGMGAEVWVHDGRIFVRGFSDLEECISRVTKVFGVHSVCPAVEMPKEDFEAICAQAVEMANSSFAAAAATASASCVSVDTPRPAHAGLQSKNTVGMRPNVCFAGALSNAPASMMQPSGRQYANVSRTCWLEWKSKRRTLNS